jgi:DNA-binding PadR family transcriptional regulator
LSRYRRPEAEALTALAKKPESSREDYFHALQLDPGLAYERLKKLMKQGLAERSNKTYPALYRLTEAGQLRLQTPPPVPRIRKRRPRPVKNEQNEEDDEFFGHDYEAILETARKTQPTSIFDVCHIHALGQQRRKWKKSLK